MADNNSGESILAFMLGGIAGAALGVLLAPCSGEETRRRLAEWLEESREKTKHFIDEEREVLQHKKEQLNAAWQAGKKAYQDPNGSDA